MLVVVASTKDSEARFTVLFHLSGLQEGKEFSYPVSMIVAKANSLLERWAKPLFFSTSINTPLLIKLIINNGEWKNYSMIILSYSSHSGKMYDKALWYFGFYYWKFFLSILFSDRFPFRFLLLKVFFYTSFSRIGFPRFLFTLNLPRVWQVQISFHIRWPTHFTLGDPPILH